MDEKFDSFFKQEGPFYPVQEFRMDSWKRAVQDTVNEVVVEVLKYHKEERDAGLLTEIFKEKWFKLSPHWFSHDTAYYLWLVHVSGMLLPFLERETGCLTGWIQYRKYPKAWSSQHFTVPVIRDKNDVKLYIFEKNPGLLKNAAHAMAATVSHSRNVVPGFLRVQSVEDGRSNIYRLAY